MIVTQTVRGFHGYLRLHATDLLACRDLEHAICVYRKGHPDTCCTGGHGRNATQLEPSQRTAICDQFTLALGLQLYQSKAGNTPWNLLMAASTMVVAPVVILFFIARRALVRGIASEGLKD